MDNITYCNGCNCMTKSKRISRAKHHCCKCGHNKTLSDVFQYELNENKDNRR